MNNEKASYKKAAALKYDFTTNTAPKILATGKGKLAEKILELARQQNIAIYKDPALVEALVQLEVGCEIPPQLYKAVAEILTFIYWADVSCFPDANLVD
jgi:flagellar biosynthesis protein